MLDAGHGGARDPGAVYEGRREKDDNLKLVLAIGEILSDRGIDVEYTRTTDVYETPYEKAMKANQAGVDLFVSIHRNSFPADNGKTYISADDLQHCGFEVIYNGNDVEIKKPAVPLKNVPEDYDKPETYSYTDLKHIYDVYNGIYNVTVDGVKTDNVYIDSLLTYYAPCIAVEDLAAADGYTVEKTDGFINIYTK